MWPIVGYGTKWASLVLVAGLASLHCAARADSPPVKVQLRAPWRNIELTQRGSPLLLELLEAANAQDPASFFPLISLLTQRWTSEQLSSASDQWLAKTVEDFITGQGLFGASASNSTTDIDTWKMSLALHDTSPRVQAFAQLYQTLDLDSKWSSRTSTAECTSWVHWDDQVLCSAAELEQALQSIDSSLSRTQGSQEQLRLLPFDHVRSTSNSNRTKASTFLLYGDPYSSNFAVLHSLLFSHTEKVGSRSGGDITYVLRWRPSLPSSLAPESDRSDHGATYLGGYGAILDLKKVDYLVIDDRKLKDDSAVGDVGGQTGSDLEDVEWTRRASQDSAWLREQIGFEDTDGMDLGALSTEEIRDIGLKAAELVIASQDPLRALQELSQNLPSHAAALARSAKFSGETNQELVEAVLSLGERRIEPGGSEVWVNGMTTLHSDFQPLKLLDMIRKERRNVRSLTHQLAGRGLKVNEALDLITSSSIGRAYAAQAEGSPASAVFDASDRIEKLDAQESETSVGAITWLNDLENDEETKLWSKDLMDLLRPMWPGRFPRLSINLFNVVFVLDLSKRESCRFLAETVAPSLGRVGLHWGLVPGGLEKGSDDDSAKMARLFWYVFDKAGPQLAIDVLRKAAASAGGDAAKLGVSTAMKEAKFALKEAIADEDLDDQIRDAVEEKRTKSSKREEMTKAYIQRLRATEDQSPLGHVFINGQYQQFQPQIVAVLQQAIQDQIQFLAPQIYYGQISSQTENLETFFYDSTGALSFRSALVPGASSAESSSMASNRIAHSSVDLFSAITDRRIAPSDAAKVYNFFYPRAAYDDAAEKKLINSTVWLLADFDTMQGASLLRKGLEAMDRKGAEFRLGLIHLPSSEERNRQITDAWIPLSALLYRLLEDGSIAEIPAAQMIELLEHYHHDDVSLDRDGRIEARGDMADEVQKIFTPSQDPVKAASVKGWATPAIAKSGDFWSSIASVVSSRLGLSVGSDAAAILVDGHLVSGFNVSDIEARDISAVVQFEAAQKIPYVMQGLEHARPDIDNLPARQRQDLLFASVSVLNSVYEVGEASQGMYVNKVTHRTGVIEKIGSSAHTFEVGDRNTSTIRIAVLLNPLSESAQKWSSILRTLSELEGAYIRVILNPQVVTKEVPLKRFYRFSAPKELTFDGAGREVPHELRFFGLPEDAVLTLGLDVPAPWLTMPEEAVYDLDNIRLADVPSASRAKGVKAVYELKHILIEGHAREMILGGAGSNIPRGMQLLLETPNGDTKLDTIVMANLAYFQFKAQPGLWKLRIRPGRSDELYEMLSVGNNGWKSPEIDVTGEDITLDTLAGLTIYPRVKKRRGKENLELLEELDAQGRPIKSPQSAFYIQDEVKDGGVASYASSLFSSAKNKVSSLANKASNSLSKTSRGTSHADINIFTVASGHLYERMTYIMILSVLKHTNSTVKFWFIENFLSPSFKEFIPHFAAEYGFEYELITYAWPHWLRSQKEKQRTIWGYKILFLDTLFPLDLSKVIFVDADQVVRTDMKELVDLDLEGKVYGYPPMGDDSEDMDGFRFWKQGYWKDYLRGRPYHISALYVVDLNTFRRYAAGDRLRGQYQALSSDPNSLANLDQDLPNNMQASLPIHTLPKEWLWCETWCSKDWLDRAKTIDLCSNPKTKEPKLDRARRQIPEWTLYDEEVQKLAARLVEENKVGASVVSPKDIQSKDKSDSMSKSTNEGKQGAVEEESTAGHHDEL